MNEAKKEVIKIARKKAEEQGSEEPHLLETLLGPMESNAIFYTVGPGESFKEKEKEAKKKAGVKW